MHFATDAKANVFPRLLVVACEGELRSLSEKFGFRLPPVSVFLFSSTTDVSELFGPHCAGLAMADKNAIVIGNCSHLHEMIRHELTHLFADRWNCNPPPLLSEGLAVHSARTFCGYRIADFARRYGNASEWPLRSFLKRDFFFRKEYRFPCYVLAGSFTGFLIERFGWSSYRTLYRTCQCDSFDRVFRGVFGITFEEAEKDWQHSCGVKC